ncbi:hypothetical protein QBC33DRAFT_538059 [Phialemonium atrogriseum]|uniref:Secreted protein n=1 Tax=Phialemonium atrogriseum TaxID=1093897 RepID=A0AAJ0FG84_9PEZI|nr:uncharacterized protein QBC33DRAFT_538059 [Phialemonium atrogriseum]KAK1767351.1 hypothetical protein QBC33DRAFT_538059 [Phialemonium atrogriseum]
MGLCSAYFFLFPTTPGRLLAICWPTTQSWKGNGSSQSSPAREAPFWGTTTIINIRAMQLDTSKLQPPFAISTACGSPDNSLAAASTAA